MENLCFFKIGGHNGRERKMNEMECKKIRRHTRKRV